MKNIVDTIKENREWLFRRKKIQVVKRDDIIQTNLTFIQLKI